MSRQGKGLVPEAEMTAAVGYVTGRKAYQESKRLALQGYDPAVAAQRGNDVANWTTSYWVFIVLCTGFPAGFLLFFGGFATLWSLGQVGIIVLLGHRLSQYRRSDPLTRLKYKLPTKVIIFALIPLWAAFCLVGALSSPAGSIQDPFTRQSNTVVPTKGQPVDPGPYGQPFHIDPSTVPTPAPTTTPYVPSAAPTETYDAPSPAPAPVASSTSPYSACSPGWTGADCSIPT